ncbi:MAG TPA: CoA-binding protein, partial [Syntrophales bacterium]|nr:CoA-binding protein [Syntrophales bacterium]
MSTLNLEKIFSPRGIAVIGAGEDPASVGGTIFKNLIDGGYEGPLFPVNPKRKKVRDRKAFPAVADLPEKTDLAVIATPASTVPDLVDQCGEAGIGGVIVASAGFRETGEKGARLAQNVLEKARPHGVRILGPNCLGIVMPHRQINASFSASPALPGRIAFLSQSGALCTAVIEWANLNNLGFSAFVSAGEMMDVDFGDLIDYFGSHGHTQSIVIYMESVTNARKFISAARAFTRTRPIVAIKAGRFSESTEAIASHTGALAGEDMVFEAAFQRAGIVRVDEIADLFHCAEILGKERIPRGRRLAVITNAGGPGIMATDQLLSGGGVIALAEVFRQRKYFVAGVVLLLAFGLFLFTWEDPDLRRPAGERRAVAGHLVGSGRLAAAEKYIQNLRREKISSRSLEIS